MSEPSDVQNRTFHPFPRLPFEIRAIIWENALNQPRIVEALVHEENTGWILKADGTTESDSVIYPIFRTKEPDRSPPLLRVCKESRALGLQTFEICLSTVIDPAVNFAPVTYTRWERAMQVLKRIASLILPSFARAARMKNPQAKYTSKGIFFQPDIDTIMLQSSFSRGSRDLLASELKTDNIEYLAMGFSLIQDSTPILHHLFVPDPSKQSGSTFIAPNEPAMDIPLKNMKILLYLGYFPQGSGYYVERAEQSISTIIQPICTSVGYGRFSSRLRSPEEVQSDPTAWIVPRPQK